MGRVRGASKIMYFIFYSDSDNAFPLPYSLRSGYTLPLLHSLSDYTLPLHSLSGYTLPLPQPHQILLMVLMDSLGSVSWFSIWWFPFSVCRVNFFTSHIIVNQQAPRSISLMSLMPYNKSTFHHSKNPDIQTCSHRTYCSPSQVNNNLNF